jgi:hypothetical protein
MSVLSTASSLDDVRADIFDEGDNLHELDAGAYTVETGYPDKQLISEKPFGCLL